MNQDKQQMPNGVTRRSFEKMEDSDKLNILFDYVYRLHESQSQEREDRKFNEDMKDENCKQRREDCDKRFKQLEWHWAKITGVTAAIVTCITIAFNYIYLTGRS